jgi:hypothetical protein
MKSRETHKLCEMHERRILFLFARERHAIPLKWFYWFFSHQTQFLSGFFQASLIQRLNQMDHRIFSKSIRWAVPFSVLCVGRAQYETTKSDCFRWDMMDKTTIGSCWYEFYYKFHRIRGEAEGERLLLGLTEQFPRSCWTLIELMQLCNFPYISSEANSRANFSDTKLIW